MSKTLQVVVSDEVYAELASGAKEDGRSLSSFVRALVERTVTTPAPHSGYDAKSDDPRLSKGRYGPPVVLPSNVPKKVVRTVEDAKKIIKEIPVGFGTRLDGTVINLSKPSKKK